MVRTLRFYGLAALADCEDDPLRYGKLHQCRTRLAVWMMILGTGAKLM